MASRNRGRKKPKLRDLSRHEPDPLKAFDVAHKLHEQQHPIAAAVLGAVAVENALETRLRERLAPKDDELWQQLTDENGSLGTFYRKIQMARALRLIDQATEHNIKIIKDVRNAFAHSKRLIGFDHVLIADELRKIEIPRYARRLHKDSKAIRFGPKSAYLHLCDSILLHLMRANLKRMQSAQKRRAEKTKALEFANLIRSTETLLHDGKSTSSGGLLGDALARLAREK